MAQPHPAVYFMRGPGPNMRIKKRVDPVTHELVAYTLEGVFGRNDRIIWMDGRPHPSPNAEYLWEGFSTGKVEGNRLTITTTHMKYGVIQRNGVPASTKATMTEHFIRHGDRLTLMTIVDDPVYLEEPFVRTSHWVRSSNITVDQRWLFEVVDEVAGHSIGYVPHYPWGTKQDGYAKKHGLPFEATQGGKATTYPEYELKVKEMLATQPSAPSSPLKNVDATGWLSLRSLACSIRLLVSHAQQPVTLVPLTPPPPPVIVDGLEILPVQGNVHMIAGAGRQCRRADRRGRRVRGRHAAERDRDSGCCQPSAA